MEQRVSRARLLEARLSEKEIPVPGLGTIVIRALSREEALALTDDKNMSTKERERRLLVAAMVDPEVDHKDVVRWQKSAPAGEIEMITTEVARLSGMLEGQAKEETVRFPDESDDGVRVLPGGETGDDALPAPGDDGE